MKKGIVVLVAVAIIGLIGIYVNNKNGSTTQNNAKSPSNSSQANKTSTMASSQQPAAPVTYKDGTYTGSNQNTVYGPVQVAAVISGGKISNVEFLEMPEDRGTSTQLTEKSEPLLRNSAVNKQSAHIDFVSGATITSQAYEESLQAALDQAAQS